MARRVRGLPGATAELLLKAALLDGDIARESWQTWHERVAFDTIDYESQLLLPLLLDNLQRLGLDDPDFPRYRGVARRIWLDNQLRKREAVGVLKLFGQANIPVMLLKGFALASLCYRDARLRAALNLDILVPVDRVGEAAGLLLAQGLHSPHAALLESPDYLATRHAATFVLPGTIGINLQWHLAPELCRPGADEEYWRDSQPMAIDGQETRTLCRSDHLFHACIEGGRAEHAGDIGWIADSAQILRDGDIDWQRFLSLTQQSGLALRLQRTLGYLRESMAQPIPNRVMTQLTAMRPGRFEMLEEYAAISSAPSLVKSAARHYANYRRNADRSRSFLRYLENALGERSLGGVFLCAVRRATQSGR